MHKVLLRTICFDFVPDRHDAGLTFWQATLAASPRQGVHFPEYHALEHPAAATGVFVQQVAASQSRIHLDIESDDVEAEVARLTGLGATVEASYRDTPAGDWTVLRDPAGLLFCVVSADRNPDFEAHAVAVGQLEDGPAGISG